MTNVKRTTRTMLVTLVTLLMLGGVQFMSHADDARASLAESPLTVDVTTSFSDPMPFGMVHLLVTVSHTGQGGPVGAELTFTSLTKPFSDGLKLTWSGVAESTSGVQPKRVVQRGGQVTWQGIIAPSGILTIEVRGRTTACVGEDRTGNATVELYDSANDDRFTAQASYVIPCLAQVDTSQISVAKSFLLPAVQAARVAARASGEPVTVRIDVTNNLPYTIHALVTDQMDSDTGVSTQAGAGECVWRTLSIRTFEGQQITYDDRVPLAALVDGSYAGTLARRIQSGETRTMELGGTAVGNPGSCSLKGVARVYAVRAIARGNSSTLSPDSRAGGTNLSAAWTPGPAQLAFLQALDPIVSEAITLSVEFSDWGDAPDSTNRDGANIDAYPGVPAHFPTVSDPATGSPPGPRHRNARDLLLGTLASSETEADTGPDRNIDPAAGKSNLDVHDDGIDPGQLSFSRCKPTSVPVTFSLAQRALDYLLGDTEHGAALYINVWVDGDRDGAWDDAFDCGAETGPALEHIVRNFVVDPEDLGVGTHTMSVPTGPVPWPSANVNDPAWLRVTLSGGPVPIPLTFAGEDYGDGRGPTTPYALGETEDYLWTNAETPERLLKGPDLVGLIRGKVEAEPNQLFGIYPSRHIIREIRYRNLGDTTAQGARIVLVPDPALAGNDNEWRIKIPAGLASGNITSFSCGSGLSNHGSASSRSAGDICRIEVDLGDLRPRQGGTIILSLRRDCSLYTPCYDLTDTLHASIESADDVDPSNNAAVSSFNIGMPPTIITAPGDVTTNKNTFDVRGIAEPDSEVWVYVEEIPSGVVQADANGRWSFALTLEDGPHRIAVWTDMRPLSLKAITSAMSRPTTVIVDSSLRWDPASLGFTKSVPWGEHNLQSDTSSIRFRPVDAMGRTDEEGWRVPLTAGETYTVDVAVTCPEPARVVIYHEELVVTLRDPDGDGIFTGLFKAPDGGARASISLDVTCGSSEASYIGQTEKNVGSVVVDASTGDPLEGATVTVYQRVFEPNGDPIWLLWPAEEYGQVNPLTTGPDGRFQVVKVNTGYDLRVRVTKDGYQPWRSRSVRLAGPWPSRTIALQPALPGPGKFTIALTGEGFDPRFLRANPGDLLEWVNVDLDEHTVTSGGPVAALGGAGGSGWDSGLLAAGEGFKARISAVGVYTIVDRENPANRATIIVDAASKVFLPIVGRGVGEGAGTVRDLDGYLMR